MAWGVNRARTPNTELPEWQRKVSELDATQRTVEANLRSALKNAEDVRNRTAAWPAELMPGFPITAQGTTINAFGTVGETQWLVLVLEPEARDTQEKAVVDDEHHLLGDGTLIHVTVWTRPVTAPPDELVAFPAAEGWVQRIRD